MLPAYYVRNPEVVLREKDENGGLLFNPDTNQIKVLNTTGLFIWELCDGNRDLPAIVDIIKASFDGVPENEVADQLTAFVEILVSAQLIGTIGTPGY